MVDCHREIRPFTGVVRHYGFTSYSLSYGFSRAHARQGECWENALYIWGADIKEIAKEFHYASGKGSQSEYKYNKLYLTEQSRWQSEGAEKNKHR
ncbi:hypothetical protein EAM_3330 [Erwinia amylovora ATCC 49946]|nr:hypothetical protein EAM_3330 [Erwinia amylovora ATCC 49946]